MKRLWILCLCLVLTFALTACQQALEEKKDGAGTDAKTTTTTTATNIDIGGVGGDLDECRVHQPYYHAISGNFSQEMNEAWIKYYEEQVKPYEDPEDPEGGFTIVAFVECNNIDREDFPELAGWTTHESWDGDLDKPCLRHYENCPYTYNQFLDAIYGDDPELSEWVFSMETIRDCL